MEKVVEEFAERLKELRINKKLSLKELGNALGVSDIAISRWERMERIPNIENLAKIANFFGVTTDYLLGFED